MKVVLAACGLTFLLAAPLAAASPVSAAPLAVSTATPAPPAAARAPVETDAEGTRLQDLDEIRDARGARESARPAPVVTAPARRKDDGGLFDGVTDRARGLGRFFARVGRDADREAHHFLKRLNDSSVDLSTPKTWTNLTIVVPGTDFGTRIIGMQLDKYGHYNPEWSHNPKFVAEIQKHWPDSRVKLFTWLSGPDAITIDGAANGLYHYIRSWRRLNPAGKVRIYAHSNGGNVSLHAAARTHASTPGALFIDELITVGTPIRPDDKMTTHLESVGKIYFVFSVNDWVAGDVHSSTDYGADPRRGVVPKILGSGHTPELAITSKLFRSAGPIESPTSDAFVVSLDAASAPTANVNDAIKNTYGADFFARRFDLDRKDRRIGEIDVSAFVAGHSDYYTPEVNVKILQRVEGYEQGLVPDAAGEGASTAAQR